MNLIGSLDLITTSLQKENIEHALIGGLALAAHGVSRATIDIDLLIDGNKKTAAKSALFSLGFSVFHESEKVLLTQNPSLNLSDVKKYADLFNEWAFILELKELIK